LARSGCTEVGAMTEIPHHVWESEPADFHSTHQ
jgi:hypothetical protein